MRRVSRRTRRSLFDCLLFFFFYDPRGRLSQALEASLLSFGRHQDKAVLRHIIERSTESCICDEELSCWINKIFLWTFPPYFWYLFTSFFLLVIIYIVSFFSSPTIFPHPINSVHDLILLKQSFFIRKFLVNKNKNFQIHRLL